MKQMSKQELQCFLEFAPHYFRYVNKALDEQVCDHVTGCHYKCQAHTWNTYPLTPQPIRFNLQPFAPKFSLRRKEKSFKSPVKFFRGHGSFVEKRHGLMPNLMEMLLKNFLQTCDSGGSREGAWGSAPLFFDQTEARRAEKGFLETPPPPLSQGLDDRATPLSQRRSWDLLVPKSVMFTIVHGVEGFQNDCCTCELLM